jgi:hypothetical protein
VTHTKLIAYQGDGKVSGLIFTVAHKGHDVTTLKARTFFIEIALLPIEVSLLRRS